MPLASPTAFTAEYTNKATTWKGIRYLLILSQYL